jgi:HPt (histidine-containing phosphotransfer) domain-containing protein
MPGLTGSALAAALRWQCPQAVLLGMSATQPAGGTPSGFHAFLLKPFDGGQFTLALNGCAQALQPQATLQDLDESVAAALAASMTSSQLSQLYALCIRDARKRAAAMQQSIASADNAAFRSEAHAIKGGASMLGACTVAALARQLEEQGINQDASRRMDEIMAAVTRLEGILLLRFPAK